MISGFTIHTFYELASLFAAIAIGMRNQIHLRLVLLLAFAFRVADDYTAVAGPIWEHICWNALFFVFNGLVTCELIYSRTTFGLTSIEKALFSQFIAVSPRDFRRLIKTAHWREAESNLLITIEGRELNTLCYVYEGSITITKAAHQVVIERPAFIGEIAFLRNIPATASVGLACGAKWIEWSAPRLRQQLSRDIALREVFNRLLGEDLADKLART